MLQKVRRFLDIRPGEGVPLLFTFAYVALATASLLLAKPIRNGLFLEEYGAGKLVYVYVAVPLVLSVLVPIYTEVAARFGQRVVITTSLLFLASNVVTFWWGLTYHPARWETAAFYIWVNCYAVIAPVQAWTFTNAVFDTRQARRLFGLVGSGGSVGAIVGGLLARSLVGPLGTRNLLLVLAGLIVVTAGIVNLAWRVRRRDRERTVQMPITAGRRGVPLNDTLALIARTPYLRQIAMLVTLVAIATQWTQYLFQAGADLEYAGDADSLTRFFGDFNSVMGGVALLVQVFMTGPMLRRWGLGVTILIFPILLGAGVTTIAFTGALWAVLMTSGVDQGLRHSVDKATFELLYLPIGANIKSNVKGAIDLIVNRAAEGVGGLLLGLATSGFLVLHGAELDRQGVAVVNLLFIAGWIGVALSMRRGYVHAIQESIMQHRLDADRTSASVLDRSATRILAARLETGEPDDIIYALNLFRIQHRGATHPAVRGLLRYPAPEVRRHAITVLDGARDVAATTEIERLLHDPDPGVRAEALVFLARHADIDPLERMAAVTDFPDYSVQAALVAYLARESPRQNREAARLILHGMVAGDGDNAVRAKYEAARLLGQLRSGFDEELERLLNDGHDQVVRAALAATGAPARVGLAPQVLVRLGQEPYKDAAVDALAAMGPVVVPLLQDTLEDPAQPFAIRGEVPRVLARIGGAAARDALAENLFESDVALRAQIVTGLSRLHHRFTELPVDRFRIEMVLTAEIMGHYRSYQILGRIGPSLAATDAVAQGLAHVMDQEQERIFRLLDPLLPDTDMRSVFLALRSSNRTLRANALELLDNVLSPALRDLVVPLFDGEVPLEDRVAKADALIGAPVETQEDAVRAMLASEEAWLKSCGVYIAGVQRLGALREDIERLASAPDPLLRHAVRDALAQMDAAAEPVDTRRERLPVTAHEDEPTISSMGETFGVG